MVLHYEITSRIIKAFYNVYNVLGYGFLEKVYENALCHELILLGFKCETQKPIHVYFKTKKVGEYYADLIVEDMVIVELKARGDLCFEHETQLMNYLKATDIEVGLLLNFGETAKFKRKIFSNYKKPHHKSN